MPRSPINAAWLNWSERCCRLTARQSSRRPICARCSPPTAAAPTAITEAEAGSDVSGIKTTATETAGGWRLNGGKLWIHNAPVADFAVVLARTAPELGKRGMSIFIVDRDRAGYKIGRQEHKMGQRASPVGALHFDNIELPKQALLGPLKAAAST